MRPAQLTPENLWPGRAAITAGECFNEAGAINAGKHPARRLPRTRNACFNEAGAINAGKRWAGTVTKRGGQLLQ